MWVGGLHFWGLGLWEWDCWNRVDGMTGEQLIGKAMSVGVCTVIGSRVAIQKGVWGSQRNRLARSMQPDSWELCVSRVLGLINNFPNIPRLTPTSPGLITYRHRGSYVYIILKWSYFAAVPPQHLRGIFSAVDVIFPQSPSERQLVTICKSMT